MYTQDTISLLKFIELLSIIFESNEFPMQKCTAVVRLQICSIEIENHTTMTSA